MEHPKYAFRNATAMGSPNIDPFAAILEAPVKANRQVASAWERFVATGEFGDRSPRNIIADSWRRCRDLGISPEADRAPSRLESEAIEKILHTAALGVVGCEVLKHYEAILEGTGHVLVLADAKGQILHAAGQRGTRERLERINFMPGGLWAEEVVGPNGVGTPLKLGRPEVVLGTEHFCLGWQPWVCYGSPVRDPESGEVIGVIDITGPVRGAQFETLGLTVAIAQAVEQRLQLRELVRRDHLHNQFLELHRRWPGEGLILLSRSGRVLDANASGLTAIVADDGAVRNRRLVDVAPRLAHSLQGMRLHEHAPAGVVEREVDGLELSLRLEMIRDVTGRLAGYLLVLRRKESVSSLFAERREATPPEDIEGTMREPGPRSLRETEDALIRRTLQQCGGEISRAARELGIARSTLYRRLKRGQSGRG
jgi:transcriptional regulator of acetoin/glycerol metabolism